MPAIDYLSAIANEFNQRRLRQQGQGDALQQALMKAQIEQKIAQADPMSQLLKRGDAARAQMNIFEAGGPKPSLFNPPSGQPTPQTSQLPVGQSLQIQRPQAPPVQRTQPNIQQAGQPQSLQPGQPPLQAKPRVGDFVPKELDVFGRPTGYKPAGPTKAQEKLSTGGAEAITKSKAAERLTTSNLKNISGQTNELSQIYSDAIEEGGFGNAWNYYMGKVRLKIGGKQADALGQTAAYLGILNEVVAAIMPTLTQQGDQKGSVRLVESVYRKIRESFPQGREYAGNAQNMIRTTIRNAYRKAKVINEMALSNEYIDKLPEKDLSTLADKINKIANQVQIKPGSEEDKALKNLINKSTQPLLKLLNKDTQKSKFRPGFVNKPQTSRQSQQNIVEGQIAINPDTNERIQFKNGRWVPAK